jgi:hypothetical protein
MGGSRSFGESRPAAELVVKCRPLLSPQRPVTQAPVLCPTASKNPLAGSGGLGYVYTSVTPPVLCIVGRRVIELGGRRPSLRDNCTRTSSLLKCTNLSPLPGVAGLYSHAVTCAGTIKQPLGQRYVDHRHLALRADRILDWCFLVCLTCLLLGLILRVEREAMISGVVGGLDSLNPQLDLFEAIA